MIPDDHNATAAAQARERAECGPSEEPEPVSEQGIALPPPPPAESLRELPFEGPIPEDLRAPWTWTDLIAFLGLGIAGLVVIGLVIVGIAVFGLGVPKGDFSPDSNSTAKSVVLVLSQGLWSAFVLLYFFIMVRARGQSPFWKTMGWRKLHFEGQTPAVSILRCLGGGAVLALLVSYASRFVGDTGELPIEEMFRSRPTVIALMAFGILVAPLVEETMFRGFLYPLIARRFGIGTGVVVTGLLFGAMHAQQLGGAWGQIVLLMGVGMVLTWVRARTGTVTASYFVHLGYNSLLFLGFFVATGGLRHIPGAQ
jgi:membrane protease YdiL (CAAX protease family)